MIQWYIPSDGLRRIELDCFLYQRRRLLWPPDVDQFVSLLRVSAREIGLELERSVKSHQRRFVISLGTLNETVYEMRQRKILDRSSTPVGPPFQLVRDWLASRGSSDLNGRKSTRSPA